MDVISREAVANYVDNMQSELTEDGRRMIRQIRVKEFIADCSSAFEGMTNGEVIQALFPNVSVYEHGSTYSVNNEYNFNSTWWNAPYKAESEE